jgi:N-acetylglucosamine-6-phosphate deacetylase
MILKNAKVLNEDFEFSTAHISIEEGIIKEVCKRQNYKKPDEEIIDLGGFMVVPGFIDIHTHGCMKRGCMEPSFESMNEISLFMAKHGVTSFLTTTRSESRETLKVAFENIGICMKQGVKGAKILGIHMEGPYFSEKFKGAQSSKFLRVPSIEEFNYLQQASQNNIKIISMAPDTEGAIDFIKEVKSQGVQVSMAHTAADYCTAIEAIKSGASHASHLFNAMIGLNHRKPGVIGAALDSEITVELICDGIHVHPAVIRLVHKIKGSEKMIIVSDSVEATGLLNDSYMRAGEKITVTEGIARTSSGNLAGSTTMLDKSLANVVSYGISLEDAVKMITINPARLLGVDNCKGSICPGKDADLVVIDSNLQVIKTFVKGTLVYNLK